MLFQLKPVQLIIGFLANDSIFHLKELFTDYYSILECHQTFQDLLLISSSISLLIRNKKVKNKRCYQWQIQHFPEGGAPTARVGAPTYYFSQFFPKTAWNWRNLDQKEGHVSLAPSPHGSTNGYFNGDSLTKYQGVTMKIEFCFEIH